MNNIIYETIKKYKWKSLFFRYFAMQLIVLLIPFTTIIAILSYHYNHTIQEKKIYTASQSLLKSKSIFSEIFTSIDKHYQLLCSDDEVSVFLLNSDINKYDITQSIKSINKSLINQSNISNYISSIYLYSPKNNYVISTSAYSNNNFLNNFQDNSWFNYYTEKKHYILPRSANISGSYFNYITIIKSVFLRNNINGLLIYNINSDIIDKMLVGNSSNETVYLVDKNGLIIYCSDSKCINANISEYSDIYDSFKNSSNDIYFDSKSNNKEMVSSCILENVGCTLIYKTSETIQNYNIFTIISVCILSILLALFFSYLIISKFYISIISIIDIFQNPYNNKADRYKSFNELTYLSKNIISVMNKNSEMEKELTEKLVLLKQSQTVALQSQLNPHFIFNTLQLINTIATAAFKKDTDINRAILLLSDLLRSVLDTTEYLCSLDEEVKYTQKYLEIQKMKYKDKFTIIWDLDPEALKLSTIKFTLQPILENAIYYGISPLRKQGIITISSKMQNDELIIQIEDNGIGIKKETLEIINENLLNENITKKNSIGLSNTNQRIKIIFGNAYGLHISSDSNGTTVLINLPIKKQF